MCSQHYTKNNIQEIHIEVICHTLDGAEILKRDLQKRPPAQKEKMRIFNAPPTVENTDIIEAIAKTYKAHRDEIQVLKSQRSRTSEDTKDWIVVMPIALGREVVMGGLTLGFRSCRVRPHTTVPRCTKCQSLEHPTRRCQNDYFCSNCGDKHAPSECNKAPKCINCKYSNREDGTNYPTDHKASDSFCPLYRDLYAEERKRLDSIFLPPQSYHQHPHNQEPQQGRGHFQEERPVQGPDHWFGPHPPPMFGLWPQFQWNTAYENFDAGEAARGGGPRHRQY